MNNTKLIESDTFPFEFLSDLAEAESWRKEIYRPVYHLHKWWAIRLGSIFRGIILACNLPVNSTLSNEFYKKHNFPGITIFDPFMGSGTTLGEAHKLGCTALGRDINPVAFNAVCASLGNVDYRELISCYENLTNAVGEKIRQLYKCVDKNNNECDTLYYFWIKFLECPYCKNNVDLFSSYIFARHTCSAKVSTVQIYCPKCHSIFPESIKSKTVKCTECHYEFNPHNGPAQGGKIKCNFCDREFQITHITKKAEMPPRHRMYAKLALKSNGNKVYLPITKKDILQYEHCSEILKSSNMPLPTLELKDGYNTRQSMNYGYKRWIDFFNDRQLLALGMLNQAINDIENEDVREALYTIFSGTLEFNNMFASYKGEGTGAIRHMFSHHILKPERMPIEGNVWGTDKSSGSFFNLFRSRLLKCIEYKNNPFEVAVAYVNGKKKTYKKYNCSRPFSGQVSRKWQEIFSENGQVIYVTCGSSHETGLPDSSIDYIVTDPPFFDNVHYSELADFFFAWRQINAAANISENSTRDKHEVQDTVADNFTRKLKEVFIECCRVMKDNGLFVFTYHHSRTEGWTSIVEACLNAGIEIINAHPVKSEMSVATPKSQAREPIDIDIIMVCRKKREDRKYFKNDREALKDALDRTWGKVCRYANGTRYLSLTDIRIIIISQYIIELCPGRQANTISDLLKKMAGDIDNHANEILDNFRKQNDKEIAKLSEKELLFQL